MTPKKWGHPEFNWKSFKGGSIEDPLKLLSKLALSTWKPYVKSFKRQEEKLRFGKDEELSRMELHPLANTSKELI